MRDAKFMGFLTASSETLAKIDRNDLVSTKSP
jgi:hypothetical protein